MIYGTFIKIITGFYIGCYGVVLGQGSSRYIAGTLVTDLQVELSCKVGHGRTDYFHHELSSGFVEKVTETEYEKWLHTGN